MLRGGEIVVLKISMDGLCHGFISYRRSGRDNVRDQVGKVLFTRFSQMNLVTSPSRLTFFAITSFLIIWRIDESRSWRNIIIASPVDLTIHPQVILDPDAAQDFDGWDHAQQGGS